MKRLFILLIAVLTLSGCSGDTTDTALRVRQQIYNSGGCTFTAVVTADYGDSLYEFEMECQTDASGDLHFYVVSPQTIQGITGYIRDKGGELTFDDQVLAFELLADGQITPVSAPWIVMRTLRSGYLNGVADIDTGTMLTIDDSYDEGALKVNIWLDEKDLPVCAEIVYDGRRILSIQISGFAYV